MSELSQLKGGLQKLIRERRAEFNTMEVMLEAIEHLPDLEAEVTRLHNERDQAMETSSLAVRELAQVREYNNTEMVRLDDQLKDKQAEHKDAMDQMDADLAARRSEYNDERDDMVRMTDEGKAQVAEAMNTARDDMNTEMNALIDNVQELKKQVADQEAKLQTARDEYEAFKAKLAK